MKVTRRPARTLWHRPTGRAVATKDGSPIVLYIDRYESDHYTWHCECCDVNGGTWWGSLADAAADADKHVCKDAVGEARAVGFTESAVRVRPDRSQVIEMRHADGRGLVVHLATPDPDQPVGSLVLAVGTPAHAWRSTAVTARTVDTLRDMLHDHALTAATGG